MDQPAPGIPPFLRLNHQPPSQGVGNVAPPRRQHEARGRIAFTLRRAIPTDRARCLYHRRCRCRGLSYVEKESTNGWSRGRTAKLATLSPPAIPDDATVLQEDNTPPGTVAPTQVAIGGTVYPVMAVLPEQGHCLVPAEQTSSRSIHGTLINYVIGLPYSVDTEYLLSGLTSADRITLTLESGTDLVFGSPQVQRTAPEDTAVGTEDSELTLVTLGDGSSYRLGCQGSLSPGEGCPG